MWRRRLLEAKRVSAVECLMSSCRCAVVFLCLVAGELGMHAQSDRAGQPGVFEDRDLKLRVYYPTEMVRDPSIFGAFMNAPEPLVLPSLCVTMSVISGM